MKKCSLPTILLCWLLLAASSTVSKAQPIISKTDITSLDSGIKETTLGDLTADALREAASADVAFVPSSALRSVDLPVSGLQSDQIGDALVATTAPANAYVTMRIKGRQIIAALERSVSHLPESFDGFLQVSGINIVYDASKPEGSRVVSAMLSNGQPILPDNQYLAAMTQRLGLGGMGYFQAWNESDITSTSDISLADVVSKYAIANQPLNIQTDGRLTEK